MAGRKDTHEKPTGPAAIRSLTSTLLGRSQFAERAGLSYPDSTTGIFKRDIFTALGYPRTLGTKDYRDTYERGGIAERIMEAYPRATWTGGAILVEDSDPGVETPFEIAAMALFRRLDIWSRILRADILAGMGRYSVLLLGARGDFTEELPPLRGEDSLLYLTPLAEDRAKIEKLVEATDDPRFGLPLTYKIQLGTGKNKDAEVHFSRILHIAEGCLDDDVYGKPRLRAIWNYLNDLTKIIGGGAEAAWKRMDPGMQLDIDPAIEISPEEETALSEEVDEYIHGIRRVMRTRGAKMNLLSASVTGFGGNADAIIQLISATTGIPQRLLTGSERGVLASTQDRSNWADRIAERRREFAEPLVNLLVDRLIEFGALPAPAEPYEISWPEIDELDESEKAEVASKMASANQAQHGAEGTVIMTANEIRKGVLGLDPLETPEPPSPPLPEMDLIEEEVEGEIAELRAAADRQKELQAIHRAADANRLKILRVFLAFWVSVAVGVDAKAMEKMLEQNNVDGATREVMTSYRLQEEALRPVLEKALLAIVIDGGEAAFSGARARGSWLSAAPSVGEAYMRAATGFEGSFNATDPVAITFAKTRGSELITEIGDKVKSEVRAMIAEGLKEGIPPARLAKMIGDTVGLRMDQVVALNKRGWTTRAVNIMKKQRGLLIARTETARAANVGTRRAWAQALDEGQIPSNQKRVWIATLDPAVRDAHVVMNGQIRGIGERFLSGDGRLIEPGEEPNCRCGQGLATPEDMAKITDGVTTPPVSPPMRTPGQGQGQAMRKFGERLNRQGEGGYGDRGEMKERINKEIIARMEKIDPRIFDGLLNENNRRTIGRNVVSDREKRSGVRELIDTWAQTSGDSNPEAVALQLAAKEELGLTATRLSHFRDSVLDDAMALLEGTRGGQDAIYQWKIARAFVRAEYELTQEYLAAEGVESMTLIRGAVYRPQYGIAEVVEGGGVIGLQPMSSFTADLATASHFAGIGLPGSTIHVIEVPAFQIISTARTGVGCLSEWEVVVAGGDIPTWSFQGSDIMAQLRAYLGIGGTFP